jgi:hypothetical protein
MFSSSLILDLPPSRLREYICWEYSVLHEMRNDVGEPPGTLIAWNVPLPDQGGKPIEFGGTVYLARVDWWDDSWPQKTIPWNQNESSPVLVMLGARVFHPPVGKQPLWASWIFSWWWPRPDRLETCRLEPPDADLTNDEAVRLNRARGAFYTWQSRRGRGPGSGARFDSAEDFEQTVRSAILALRARGERESKAAIGRYIGRTYRTSRWDDDPTLEDPGGQVREWEKKFGIDIERLKRGL